MVGRGVVNAMKVLVIDDDEFLMVELAEFFKRQGCSVSTGQNGVEAVELVRSEQPDLLIMDVQMPRMDGLEAVAVRVVSQTWSFLKNPCSSTA